MIIKDERHKITKYHLLTSYIAMLQSNMVSEELEFAESQAEVESIRAVYDMVDQYQPCTISDINEKVFYHPEDTLSLYPLLFSNSITTFLGDNQIGSFLLISHTKLSFIGTIETDITQLQHARQLFFSITADKSYDQAYKVGYSSFIDVIQALFWIVRYDATIPYIFIQPHQTNYFLSICKYGNLHVYSSPKDTQSIESSLSTCGLLSWHGNEVDRFSNTEMIEGRFTSPEE